MNSPQDTFILEARDLLQTLEETLLELEGDPTNGPLIDAAFRALHTLKGSGDMFGFGALAAFIHHFEDAFDQVREGKAKVSPALIAVALDSRDHLAALLDLGADAEPTPTLADAGAVLLTRLGALNGKDLGQGASVQAAETPAKAVPVGAAKVFHIQFSAEPGALKTGFRPDLLWVELAELGTLEVTTFADRVPPIEQLDPSECYLHWAMVLKTDADRAAIEDVFIFYIDAAIQIEEQAAEALEMAPAQSGPDQVSAQSAPQTTDQIAPNHGPKTPKIAAPSPSEEMVQTPKKSDTVRVQADRLDDLMDQLGELVIAQARLKSIADDLNEPRLDATVEEIDALVTGLRDTTLSIRMLPVSMVFGKFRRVVRDLSVELDKPANLVTEGEDTEVDKNIIDSLTEPLVHMIRNALDHGVESVAARRAAGKPDAATVRLSARQSGGEVLISISDDGGGLNTDAIRARAVERGLISEDQLMNEDALNQLIFEPGFSTAQALSAVSGRGVGMDAVRRVVVDSLRGAIDVSSKAGQGTTITLRLPLTLAIIDGLLVDIDGDPFVLPLSSVEECVDLPISETGSEKGRSILHIRDKLVPYLKMDVLFGYPAVERPGRRVAIVNAEGKRIGLVVDDVLGQLQTVIKPLSLYHQTVEELAGSTILGDGSVALIIDVNALVRNAETTAGLAA